MTIRVLALSIFLVGWHAVALGQTVSGIRGVGGGVAPLFNLVGPGNLYLDNQGTQGYMYTPGNNFESYNFRNPTTGQAWSGAIMTLGPQLSIGIIQGSNQIGSPLVLVPPPTQLGAPLIAPFSLTGVNPLVTPVLPTIQAAGAGGPPLPSSQLVSGTPRGGGVPSVLLIPPRQPPSPVEIESSLLEVP
jgi:hypothetical protein